MFEHRQFGGRNQKDASNKTVQRTTECWKKRSEKQDEQAELSETEYS